MTPLYLNIGRLVYRTPEKSLKELYVLSSLPKKPQWPIKHVKSVKPYFQLFGFGLDHTCCTIFCISLLFSYTTS